MTISTSSASSVSNSANSLASISKAQIIDETIPSNQNKEKNASQIMKLPPKSKPVGRPKGSGQTVAGVNKKRKNQNEIQSHPTKKSKFLDLNATAQSLTLIQWLTNKSVSQIKSKKITYDDIIQDSIMFNRLRNDSIDLNVMKPFMEKKCFRYIEDEIERLNERKYWACAKCKRNLNGIQVMCHICLDWFHVLCTDITAAAAKKENVTYFCKPCRI